ncbi:MAG: DUF4405 domain-containing protein [Coriobacteriales bacterium]|nr:DUF4405 domain-containing protein [Coriobacteriales bacterium]
MTTRNRLIVDILAAVVYLIAANPAVTGLAVHEWVSVGLVVVFVIHCALSGDVIIATIRKRLGAGAVLNLILDAVTLVVFMVVTVSGLMVSRFLLPLLGFVAPGYFFWNPLHSISAKVLLALLLVHVVAHWRWLAALFDFRRKASAASPVDKPEVVAKTKEK